MTHEHLAQLKGRVLGRVFNIFVRTVVSAMLGDEGPVSFIDPQLVDDFDNQVDCDVVFTFNESCDDRNSVKAHKCVLATTSGVFRAMFYGCGLKMTVHEDADGLQKVCIPDVCPSAFQHALRIIYGSKTVSADFQLHDESVMDLGYVAEKYDLALVQAVCDNYLVTRLCPENVMALLTVALRFHFTKLREACLLMAEIHTDAVLSPDNTTDVDQQAVESVLSRPLLSYSHELVIFNYVMAWAERECRRQGLEAEFPNLRKMLSPLAPFVPIAKLEAQNYGLKFSIRQLFTEEEKKLYEGNLQFHYGLAAFSCSSICTSLSTANHIRFSALSDSYFTKFTADLSDPHIHKNFHPFPSSSVDVHFYVFGMTDLTTPRFYRRYRVSSKTFNAEIVPPLFCKGNDEYGIYIDVEKSDFEDKKHVFDRNVFSCDIRCNHCDKHYCALSDVGCYHSRTRVSNDATDTAVRFDSPTFGGTIILAAKCPVASKTGK